jgi:hypothetical protein
VPDAERGRSFQNRIGFGGPLKGLWLGVALGDPSLDCCFEIGGAREYTAPDALACNLGEPPLDEMEP